MAGSISNWLDAYRKGDQAAANQIWSRYYGKLVRAAKRYLHPPYPRASDEEDVAAFAFERFFQGVNSGRFPNLCDRDDLWRILLHLSACRIRDLRRAEHRLKRLIPTNWGDSERVTDLDQIVGDEPSPEIVVASAESLKDLLESLSGGNLREMAVLKLEGLSNLQIAHELGCSLRTVERKLRRIRHEWWQRTDLLM